MQNINVERVLKAREIELKKQFNWIYENHINSEPITIRRLGVTVWDHWLSRDDANKLLENVSPAEQKRRDELLNKFCSEMVNSTEVLSFVFRGRDKNRSVFRQFRSTNEALKYCRAGGGKFLKHHHFHVVLPEFGCVFYESWDSTYVFYAVTDELKTKAQKWALKSGAFVLDY